MAISPWVASEAWPGFKIQSCNFRNRGEEIVAMMELTLMGRNVFLHVQVNDRGSKARLIAGCRSCGRTQTFEIFGTDKRCFSCGDGDDWGVGSATALARPGRMASALTQGTRPWVYGVTATAVFEGVFQAAGCDVLEAYILAPTYAQAVHGYFASVVELFAMGADAEAGWLKGPGKGPILSSPGWTRAGSTIDPGGGQV